MTALTPDEPAAVAPFARARALLAPEAERHSLTVPELLHRLALTGRRPPLPGPGRSGSIPPWTPHTLGTPASGGLQMGPLSSGKSSHADLLRAHLTAVGAVFREETVTRDGHAYTEFHVERPESDR
ncbi:hypothetical protein ACFWNK_30850 [Streptomyces sp. NPDC058417]|uniref:hypothetical protein n=1 Tax=unclassified Streptomyces TaxID=2593676 RepID=UPI00366976CC